MLLNIFLKKFLFICFLTQYTISFQSSQFKINVFIVYMGLCQSASVVTTASQAAFSTQADKAISFQKFLLKLIPFTFSSISQIFKISAQVSSGLPSFTKINS